MGELWGVFCEYLRENWLHFKGTSVYLYLDSKFVPEGPVVNKSALRIITWANVDQDFWHGMASLGHNWLKFAFCEGCKLPLCYLA